jgi:hemin uptake protein HemP
MNTDTPKPTSSVEVVPSNRSSSHVVSPPCLRSEALFGRTREILIEHGGAYYRLRLTHSNKLILTK